MAKMESEQEMMTPEQFALQAALKAKRDAAKGNQLAIVPNRLAIIVDTSGSMGLSFPPRGTRADAATKAMRTLISHSNSRDTAYCMVAYNSQSTIIHEMGSSYSKLLATSFEPTGGTSLNPALGKALSQNIIRAIILSDGQIYDSHHCLETIKLLYIPKQIKIDTIAIGEADAAFLQEISELTGGHFEFAKDSDELDKVFLQLEPQRYLLLEHKES